MGDEKLSKIPIKNIKLKEGRILIFKEDGVISKFSIGIPTEKFDSKLDYESPDETYFELSGCEVKIKDMKELEGKSLSFRESEKEEFQGSVYIGWAHNPVDINNIKFTKVTDKLIEVDLKLLIDFEHENVAQNEVVDLKAKLKVEYAFIYPKNDPSAQLYLAVRSNKFEVVKELLAKGVSKEFRAEINDTAIHVASKPEMVKLLLQYKANLHTVNQYGSTALFGNSIVDVPQVLIDAGINVNHQNDEGETALHVTCYSWLEIDALVELLLKSGAKVNLKNKKGQTPLDIFLASDHKGETKESKTYKVLRNFGAKTSKELKGKK